jgi:hypothetical protein
MSGVRIFLVFALVVVVATANAFATTYVVGTCKHLQSFPTISAAVTAVPPSSTVFVCPGTYAEQVTINQPLILKGVTDSPSGQVIIAAPPGGLSTNVNSILLQQALAAQVGVTAGPVNIVNITVDGANNNLNGSSWLAGIFYQGGSSGVINHVTTRNQTDSGHGVGIWLENGTANAESITLQNSSVHNVDYSGIIAGDTTLTATISGNWVSSGNIGIAMDAAGSATSNRVTAGTYGIIQYQGAGKVSSNNVFNSPTGIYMYGNGTVSGNTVLNNPTGIYVSGNGSVASSNKIVNSSSYGISFDLTANGATVKSNTITESNIAIELNCTTGNIVSGNSINDAATGINDVPSSFSGANSLFSVALISNIGSCP